MNDMMVKLEDVFGKKAPALPENIKEFIVKYGPYIDLVMLVLALPLILGAFGLAAVFSPVALMGGAGAYAGFSLSIIISIVALALQVIALPGLFKRSMQGWTMMFYATLVNAVGSLISGNVVSMLIGLVISFYFMFQIKPLYK